jgi:glutathione S-transferase
MAEVPYAITLYTYHGCPYAHRVHIALEELGLKFTSVHIDLDVPREPWYLQVNPVRPTPAHSHFIR